jgi:putative SOS response-associated peptidase YedK
MSDAVALLTVDAGPDVTPNHARQPVVLDRTAWKERLDGSGSSGTLLIPPAAGTLTVVQALKVEVSQRL